MIFDDRLYCRKCKRKRSYTREYQETSINHLGEMTKYVRRSSYCSYCGFKLAEDLISLESLDEC